MLHNLLKHQLMIESPKLDTQTLKIRKDNLLRQLIKTK